MLIISRHARHMTSRHVRCRHVTSRHVTSRHATITSVYHWSLQRARGDRAPAGHQGDGRGAQDARGGQGGPA